MEPTLLSEEAAFADVLLPLAFPGALTYAVPASIREHVLSGRRVVVPMGRGREKIFTGIVARVHGITPPGVKPKSIITALDKAPLVNGYQLALWGEMASHYLCGPGEVMAAALPNVFMLTSESRISASGKSVQEGHLSDRALRVMDALEHSPVLTMEALREVVGTTDATATVNEMIGAGLVTIAEELKERYTEPTEKYVRLGVKASTEELLHHWFDALERKGSEKQQRTLMKFVELSGCFSSRERPVKRTALQKAGGVDATVIKQLEKKGVLEVFDRKEDGAVRSPDISPITVGLSPTQTLAIRDVRAQMATHAVTLLRGVTASGKTEIYIQLIADAIARGEQVLYLLPEIALTTQVIGRLRKWFGDRVLVYHSRLSQSERAGIWKRMLDDPSGTPIVLGARSAVLLPFSELGLVVVDEEHEPSYKQQDPAPRYHARDTAILLARQHDAKVLLGSATPSIESMYNARNGKYGQAELLSRFGDAPMPAIETIDLTEARKRKQMRGHFAQSLLDKITGALAQREQVILFQNRRGYVPLWQCEICDWTPECEQCDVSLTYHKRRHRLSCHYCGREYEPPTACAKCGSRRLRMLGFGTEKVEEDLALIFPEARIARMDQDTTRGKHAYHRILSDFSEGAIDILVGTQMVTKGLDFDHVNLVGVLSVDGLLRFPEFRAHERAFQLMAQVAGRAGRRNKAGTVAMQTHDPGHPVIGFVKRHDVEGFYEREIEQRHKHLYPPFSRLVRLTLKHVKEERVIATAQALTDALRPLFGDRVLGPETPAVARVRTLYLRNVLVKLDRGGHHAEKEALRDAIDRLFADKAHAAVRLITDVDPV
ncbi:MAG: primosomal protein N' [Flavobacteriales bacterium]